MFSRDYHVHTAYCGHAFGEMEDYVRQAVAGGLQEICFCDHMPLPDGCDPDHRMAAADVEPYIAEIERLRLAYPELTIHLGFEADYISGLEDYLREFRRQYRLDYYLMSIHFISGWPKGEWAFAYPFGSATIAGRYRDYFRTMQAGVRSGIFDAVAHFDLIKRPQYPVCELVPDLVDELLTDIAAAGMAMEFNSSGLRKPIAETFPAEEVLARSVNKGIPVCLGSDAHQPEHVAYAFGEAAALLARYPTLIPYRIRPCAGRRFIDI